MSNSILCAIDISNTGDDTDVLKTADKLAQIDGAQLDVITVVPDFGRSLVGGFFDENHHEKMVETAKEELTKIVGNALGDEKNKIIRHIVSTGKTYEEVLKVAQKAKSDLIVIGAHKADIKDYLLGPNAARVVRHSDCSVYVVR